MDVYASNMKWFMHVRTHVFYRLGGHRMTSPMKRLVPCRRLNLAASPHLTKNCPCEPPYYTPRNN